MMNKTYCIGAQYFFKLLHVWISISVLELNERVINNYLLVIPYKHVEGSQKLLEIILGHQKSVQYFHIFPFLKNSYCFCVYRMGLLLAMERQAILMSWREFLQ